MDIILVILIFIIGSFRMVTNKTVAPDTNIVVNEYTGEVYSVQEQLPIGTNLMLHREPDAFCKIVKELKLK